MSASVNSSSLKPKIGLSFPSPLFHFFILPLHLSSPTPSVSGESTGVVPVYAVDGSWSGYFWSFFGYPTEHPLDDTNPLTQLYIKDKPKSIKYSKEGTPYIAVEMD